MNASNDLADTSFDTSLFPQLSNIFTGLADNDTGVLCADKGAQSKRIVVSR